ncbi:hypothetical protein IQ270_27350 [Microcoleus sp. LEGE 07076]|uniref:hypothetical protein n=1 Tax=Microcoleus sp. LEGE 07076 TaxID=915322 RepID=UPI0018824694|nr:hypothetical protein [Microcoleus sp. LEGE 07076]MBE9188255.1 hypothetical protein [Microcoleus sp. LEGE 07076]
MEINIVDFDDRAKILSPSPPRTLAPGVKTPGAIDHRKSIFTSPPTDRDKFPK